MKIAVLIHGVRRKCEEVLKHNIGQLEAFFAPMHPQFSTFIYTERRSWTDSQLRWLHEALERWDIQSLDFWEDESSDVKNRETEIAQEVAKTFASFKSFHAFMPRMWFRRWMLFQKYVKTKKSDNYDLVLQVRLFDIKIDVIGQCPTLLPNTLYHSVDTLFFGEHQAIERLMMFGSNSHNFTTRIDYNSKRFRDFRTYDKLLHDIQPTHSSEVQIWNYIHEHFQAVNLRENITAPQLKPDAVLRIKLFR